MNLSRAPKSQKPRKSRTQPPDRRAFTPGVDRLEQRISLSSLSPTGGTTTDPPGFGLTSNHNETLVPARPPRRRHGAARKARRPLAPAVEGLERRISLSSLSPTGNAGHIIPPPFGTTLNHNETLVRAPRRRPLRVG
jgi:hypothetical protein